MTKIILSSLEIMHSMVLAMLIAVAMVFFAPAVSAQAIHRTSDFNHMKTGFPLTGVHINVECETCHAGGIFKGTPTDCAGCHSAGRRVVAPFKPANHIISNAPCETCHTNTVSFMGARFNHMGVQPRACMTCHNGGMGPGKPGGHLPTNSPCDTCHRTSAWIPAGFDHMGVVPGTCATCHNGNPIIGKPASHIATSSPCDTCHTTTTFLFATGHAIVAPGTCGTCHGGQYPSVTSKTPGHIPTTGNGCDSCHNNTNYISFANSPMNHAAAVSTRCDTCHNGAYTTQGTQGAKAKPSNHIPTTNTGSLDCNTCHISSTLWAHPPEVMNHSGITVCKTCHNSPTPYLGSMTTKQLGNHEGSSAGQDCISCHALRFSSWNNP